MGGNSVFKMKNHFVYLFASVLIVLELANYSQCKNDNLLESVQSVITYFNNSVNLVDRVEMVERFYEIEREEGVFALARLRVAPTELQKVFDDYEALEFESKHKRSGDKKILRKIKDIEHELSENFGARDKNFKIRRNDPLVQNIRAADRMTKHWEGIMDEFREYTESQINSVDSYKIIRDFGIALSPTGDDMLVVLLQDEGIKKFLENHPKSENFDQKVTFDDIVAKVKDQIENSPKQTSQEIKALQDVLNGQEVDPIAKEMLTGFIPEVNRMCMTIITKLFALEATVNTIEDESKGYGFYIMQIRDDLYADLEKLRERFDPDNSSADKDEL